MSPATAFASGLAKTDWPTFGGNSAHNKISPSTSKAPLTIYIRQTPGQGTPILFRGDTGPVIANNTIYAFRQSNTPNGFQLNGTLVPAALIAYDLKGNQKWSAPVPSWNRSGYGNMAVADDGTIYVGNTVGLNAFSPNGAVKFADKCIDGSGNGLFGIAQPVLAKNGNVYLQGGGTADILVCNPTDGSLSFLIKSPLGGGRGIGGVAIDSQDIIYVHTREGTRAIRASDGSEVWTIPNLATSSPNNNYALSPDEKYLAENDADSLNMVDVNNRATNRGLKFQYALGTTFGVFTFGLNNRIYISVDSRTTGGTGIGKTVPTTTDPALTGRVCALDVPTGNDIWCNRTPTHLEATTMLVDSNNALYLNDPLEHSVFAFDADGHLQWKYLDRLGINSSDAPAMTDDGKLFYADDFLYGFRPWTLVPTALKKPAPTSTSVYFTVKSSMLRRDLQDGVATDNQVQVRLDGGKLIPLKYLHQDGDDSVWEGVYSVSTGTDLSKVQLKGYIEAIANQTTSALTTHFASVPSGFNNTGMVQSFDLGTVDKLFGTAAQSTVATPDEFTMAYQATVGWIRNTSLTVWSYLKSSYASIADFMMR